MTITYRLTFRDRLAFAAYHLPHSPVVIISQVAIFLFISYISIIPAIPKDASSFSKVFTFVVLELLLAGLMICFLFGITALSMISKKNKTLMAERTLTADENGFISESSFGKSEVKWTMVQKTAKTRNHIFVYLSQENAVVIPRRAFTNSTQWEELFNFFREKTKKSRK